MVNLKRKEFLIYAIALMLVAAGYFNYLNFDLEAIKTSTSIENKDVNTILDSEQIAEESENSDNTINYEKIEQQNNEINENVTEGESYTKNLVEVSTNETKEKEENKTNIGDAVLVSSDDTVDNMADIKDYFATTKLQRNKMYAEMIKKYEDLVNNSNLSEVQKSIATDEKKQINNNKNAIMICENLILSKDFEECVILVNDQSVNIIVHVEGGLDTERVSQIQNIISRELSTEIDNIHISEK